MLRQNMEQFQRKITEWTNSFPKLVYLGFKKVGAIVVEDVKTKRLSGQVLGVRTGRLRNSIKFKAVEQPRPSLKIGTDVNYGAIWMSRGRDFLTPSINAKSKAIQTAILKEIMEGYEK